MVTLHIGIDDTDSPSKGCTTYLTALLAEKLENLGAGFADYPNLIRLNPNIPWKTRGNGALCLRIRCEESLVEQIKETALSLVKAQSDLGCGGTAPGVVFFIGEKIPAEIKVFSMETIQGVEKLKDALELARKHGVETVEFKSGRGVIGALAAVGETLEGDHTFELIAYRTPAHLGTKRRVDALSVKTMDEATAPLTFNNIDRGRVLITPRGPDPILFGIRGENPETVKKAFTMVKTSEPIERWLIFRSNQGTDAHLRPLSCIGDVHSYAAVTVKGVVSGAPRTVRLRHVIFTIEDGTARVDCAAYEPTGDLRKAARQLMPGDVVEVSGGVRPSAVARPLTINLEKMHLLKLTPKTHLHNPACPKCGKTMSSMGRNQGFRCEECGYKSKDSAKVQLIERRGLEEKLYITSPHSQRHLTKPFRRYGMEKRLASAPFEMVPGWHS